MSQEIVMGHGDLKPEEFSGQIQKRKFVLLTTFIELALIVFWAFWVGRGLLDFNLNQFPVGPEYPMVTQSHFIWTNLFKCGACVFWNGFTNGGAPAFAELHGGILHPFVIITTLLFGVINGGKIVIILSLLTAGFAQWRMAKAMYLRWPIRLWVAALAVVGGNIAGKIENGGVLLALSTAFASLTLAFLVELIITNKRSVSVWLGISLALTILSGQGYMQISLIFIFLPAFFMFVFKNIHSPDALWKNFLISIGTAILLSGIFWVPLLHFFPNFAKDGDTYFSFAQPLEYLPLNLLIRDFGFYNTDLLQKGVAGFIYINFIGWIPCLLAALSLRFMKKTQYKLFAFFFASIILIFLFSSAEVIRGMQRLFDIVGYVRYPSIMTGLIVPLILGLAAWTLNFFLDLPLRKINISFENGKVRQFSYRWILFGIIAISSIIPVYQFSRLYIGVTLEITDPAKVVEMVKTPSSQWISIPSDEYTFIPYLLSQGTKMAVTFRPWHWQGRETPASYYEISRDTAYATNPEFVDEVDGLYILKHPENQYAFIMPADGSENIHPCSAKSVGGNIDVICDKNSPAGKLIVNENFYSGWSVKLDGIKQPLQKNTVLQTIAQTGKHTYSFRYRPFDVYAGMALTLAGIGISMYLLFIPRLKRKKS